MYLYNPFSRDYKELPKNLASEHQIVGYGLGVDPVTNEYKVIKIGYTDSTTHHRGFNYFNKQVSEVYMYSLHSKIWTNRGSVPYKLYSVRESPGVYVNGRLLWACSFARSAGECFYRVILSNELWPIWWYLRCNYENLNLLKDGPTAIFLLWIDAFVFVWLGIQFPVFCIFGPWKNMGWPNLGWKCRRSGAYHHLQQLNMSGRTTSIHVVL